MKIVFFDIDGTLWDGKMQIPQSTIDSVRELRKNGHKAFICSGRARANIIDRKLFDIGFDGVLAACGNHVEMDGKILYQNLIPNDIVKLIVETAEKCKMPVVLEGPVKHWVSVEGFENDPYIDYLEEMLGDKSLPLLGYTEDIEINKFSADVWDYTDYATVKENLSPYMDFIEHEGTVIECVPKGTSKATGIKWICDYLNIPLEDAYGVGDSINDVDMLATVGHGIAMGNGTEPAKRVAEYITTDIHEDGIQNALRHYGLI